MNTKNKAMCKNCKEIIESKHVHDWVSCSCFKTSHAALNEYMLDHPTTVVSRRVMGKCEFNWPTYDYEALDNDGRYHQLRDNLRGFYLDGGPDTGPASYTRCGGNFDDIEWIKEDLE